MRRIFVVFLLISFCLPSLASRHSSGGTVYVHGYVRKNGTYVTPHYRHAPGTAPRATPVYRPPAYRPHTSNVTPTYRPPKYRSNISTSSRNTERNSAQRDAFQRQHPCPATGKTSGPCSGYVVDHIHPLECGGADAPENMQWQTVEAAKEKDKTERQCR